MYQLPSGSQQVPAQADHLLLTRGEFYPKPLRGSSLGHNLLSSVSRPEFLPGLSRQDRSVSDRGDACRERGSKLHPPTRLPEPAFDRGSGRRSALPAVPRSEILRVMPQSAKPDQQQRKPKESSPGELE